MALRLMRTGIVLIPAPKQNRDMYQIVYMGLIHIVKGGIAVTFGINTIFKNKGVCSLEHTP